MSSYAITAEIALPFVPTRMKPTGSPGNRPGISRWGSDGNWKPHWNPGCVIIADSVPSNVPARPIRAKP